LVDYCQTTHQCGGVRRWMSTKRLLI
jgi:hypothetical protein